MADRCAIVKEPNARRPGHVINIEKRSRVPNIVTFLANRRVFIVFFDNSICVIVLSIFPCSRKGLSDCQGNECTDGTFLNKYGNTDISLPYTHAIILNKRTYFCVSLTMSSVM